MSKIYKSQYIFRYNILTVKLQIGRARADDRLIGVDLTQKSEAAFSSWSYLIAAGWAAGCRYALVNW